MRAESNLQGLSRGRNVVLAQARTGSRTCYVPTSFDAERELEIPLRFPSMTTAPSFEPALCIPKDLSLEREAHSPPRRSGLMATFPFIQDGVSNTPVRKRDSIKALTTESFLKRSAQFRTYRGRKRIKLNKRSDCEEAKIASHSQHSDIEVNSECSDAWDRAIDGPGENESNFERLSPRPAGERRPKTRRGKRRKLWKDRIYEAAISTHCEPDDCFAQNVKDGKNHADSSRAPLHFVPYCPGGFHDETHMRRSSSRSSQRRRIVDNHQVRRTKTVMRTSTFSTRHIQFVDAGTLVNTLDRLPLSKWNFNLHSTNQSSLTEAPLRNITKKRMNKKKQSPGALDLRDVAYNSLDFISLEKAEVKYKAMFADHG